MKARGVIVVDYDLPGGLMEAAEELEKLKVSMKELARGNPRIVFADCDIKERRGNGHPDVRNLKIRTS